MAIVKNLFAKMQETEATIIHGHPKRKERFKLKGVLKSKLKSLTYSKATQSRRNLGFNSREAQKS